ncbi:MAG: acetylglutamate kinase [Erysipelotrichaceae bacterium]|nr:acetylglutamate kinase [Erysipelotrichaceae bacterium]
MDNKDVYKAHILAKAVPHMQRYRDKVVVIKYGGNAMVNEKLMNNVIEDVCLMNIVGIRVVLVHGGGPEISKTLKKMNIESKFINGLRYTDSETIGIVQEVLAGKVNKELVKLIIKRGEKSIGLCGIDNKLLKAEKVESDVDLGFVGRITEVNSEILSELLDKNYIPVVASIAMDDEGQSYNVNADLAAAAVAASLKAENLLIVSDIPGLLRDVNDEDSLISEVSLSDVEKLKEEGIIAGGMIPKVDSIIEVINDGVKQAVIVDGRVPHSMLVELFTNSGAGTLFRQ